MMTIGRVAGPGTAGGVSSKVSLLKEGAQDLDSGAARAVNLGRIGSRGLTVLSCVRRIALSGGEVESLACRATMLTCKHSRGAPGTNASSERTDVAPVLQLPVFFADTIYA